MYLISDNVDTLTGMRLAGVDGIVVHERGALRTAIETVSRIPVSVSTLSLIRYIFILQFT